MHEGLPLHVLATVVLAWRPTPPVWLQAWQVLGYLVLLPLRLLQQCDADEFTAAQLAVAVMLCLGYNLLW
jgi:hypothetical protein